MNWLLELIVLWIAFDIFIIASIWYCRSTIRTQWPAWWKRHICDSVTYIPDKTALKHRRIINEERAGLYSPSER